MKSYILDTNCLLSFVTSRNIRQQKIITDLLVSASRLDTSLVLISNVVTEFVYVLDSVYHADKILITNMVIDLLQNSGVQFHHGYFPDIIFKLWPHSIREFGDAVIAAAAMTLKTPLLTFDRKFSRKLEKLGIAYHFLQ